MRTSHLPISIVVFFLSLFSLTSTAQVNLTAVQRPVAETGCDSVVVDFIVTGLTDVGLVSHTIEWDASVLDGARVEYNSATTQLVASSTFNPGSFSYFLTDPNFASTATVPDNDTLYTLILEVLDQNGATNLSVATVPAPDAFNADFQSIGFNFTGTNINFCPGNGGSDTTPPVFTTCPIDITVNLSAGATGESVSWSIPQAMDETDSDVTVTQIGDLTRTSGDFFPIGTYNIQYQARDDAGNTAICSFTIIVNAATNSTDITFVAEQQPADCGATTITVDVKVRNFNDIEGFSHVIAYDETALRLQTNGVTLGTALTGLGVNPIPNTDFVYAFWTTPNNPVSIADETVLYTLTFDVVGAITGNTTVRQLPESDANYPPIASNNVTVNGVATNYIFQEEIIELTGADTEDPVFDTCPTDVIQAETLAGQTTAVVNFTPPTAIDNCGQVNLTSNFQPGAAFPIGTTTVTYTATDQAGNTATCSFDVIVSAGQGSGSTDITFFAEQQPADCGATTVSIDVKVRNFNNIEGFSHVVAYDVSALDLQVNGITVSNALTGLNVQVIPNTDLIYAIWTTPNNPVSLAEETILYTLTFDVIGNITPNTIIRQLPDTDSSYPALASNEVVVDGSSADYVFQEEVISLTGTDTEDPIFTNCSTSDITAETLAGETTAIVTWTVPMATDNCSLSSVTSNFDPGDAFPIGTTTVVYTATDEAGNTSTCEFDVVVSEGQGSGFDGVTFIAEQQPADCGATTVTVDVRVRNFTEVEGFSHVVAYDVSALDLQANGINISTALSGLSVISVPNTDLVYALWTTPSNPTSLPDETILYTLTFDVVGEVGSSTIVRQLNDDDPNYPNLASNEVVVNGASTEYRFFQTSIVFNSATDTTPPVFTSCPTDISQRAPAGQNQAVVNWTAPEATDECGVQSTTSNFSPGDVFPIGTTEVIYIAEDVNGNRDSCIFNVTVEPTIFDGITFRLDQQEVSCDATTVTIDVAVENFTNIEGLSHILVYDRNILSLEPDNITIGTALTGLNVQLVTANELIYAIWTTSDGNPVTLADDEIIYSLTFDIIGDIDADTTVRLMAEDETGYPPIASNTVTVDGSSAEFVVLPTMINISDNEPPMVISCPMDTVITISPQETSVEYSWSYPEVMDNCGIVDTTFSPILSSATDTAATFEVGTTRVGYIFADAAGNMDTCQFVVEVQQRDVQSDLVFKAEQRQLRQFCNGSRVAVEILVENFDTVSSINQLFSWDSNLLTLEEFRDVDTMFLESPLTPVDLTPESASTLRFEWSNPNGLTLEDNTRLFVLLFTVNNPPIPAPGTLFDLIENTTTIRTPFGDDAITPMWIPTNITTDDVTLPTFSLFPNDTITISTVPDACIAFPSWEVAASDNCSRNILQVQGTANPQDTFQLGFTTVVYTATDEAGNEARDSFVVHVIDDVAPQFLDCPTDITIPVPIGTTDTLITWAVPTATDNCYTPTLMRMGEGMITAMEQSATLTGNDTLMVAYIATDEAGNVSDTCRFTIITIEGLPIEITCPADVLAFAPADKCEADVFDIGVIVSDSAAIDNSSFTILNDGQLFESPVGSGIANASGRPFPIGISTVTYMVTDTLGTMDECSFQVEVRDTFPPVFECPMDMVVALTDGDSIAVENIGLRSADDNCPLAELTVTYEITAADSLYASGDLDASGTEFPVGTYTIQYTVSDAAMNTDSCSFTVTVVEDKITFVCPMDTIVVADANCSATIDGFVVEITDGFELLDSTFATLSGATAATLEAEGLLDLSNVTFGLGTTNIVYEVLDTLGLRQSCMFQVTVEDRTPPVLDCVEGEQTITIPPTETSAIVTTIPAIVTDNCDDDPNISYVRTGIENDAGFGDANTLSFGLGRTNVIYFASDAAGNVDSCTFIVNVVQQMIEFDCPQDQLVFTAPTSCDTVVNNIDLVITAGTDMLDSTRMIFTGATQLDSTLVDGVITASGFTFNLGVTMVTYEVIDTFGNVSTCTFNVEVADNVAPVLDCPTGTIAVDLMNNGDAMMQVGGLRITATDNCDENVVVGYSLMGATMTNGIIQGNPDSLMFNVGQTTMTHYATDDSGNVDSCAFEVLVRPARMTFDCAGPNIITIVDTCGAVVPNIQIRNLSPLGLLASSRFEVSGATTFVSDTVFGLPPINASGTFLNVGDNTITYFLIDTFGREESCTINRRIRDTQAPTFDCPQDTTVRVLPDSSSIVVQNISVTNIVDICDVTVDYRLEGATMGEGQNDASGTRFNVGQTLVTYILSDGTNRDSCTFQVTVLEQLLTLDCPSDTTVNVMMDTCGAVVNNIGFTVNDPTALAMSSYTLLYEGNLVGSEDAAAALVDASGQFFDLGTTMVTYIIEDTEGTTQSCTFDVTVVDNIAPTFDCPGDLTITIPESDTMAMADIGITNVMDNCDMTPIITHRLVKNGMMEEVGTGSLTDAMLPVGTTVVTYFVTDASSNIDSCTFTVLVETNPLALDCPMDTAVVVNSGMDCGQVVGGIGFSVSDLGLLDSTQYILTGATTGTASLQDTLVDASDVFFNFGTTTVTYTVVDTMGVAQICAFNVTVIDRVPPMFTCPDDVVVFIPEGDTATVVNNIGLIDMFDCDKELVIEYTLSGATEATGINNASGEQFNLDTTLVTYRLTDGVGNTDSCSFEVVVRIAPIGIECPPDTIVAANAEDCTRMVNDLAVMVMDTGLVASITYDLAGATMLDSLGMGDISGTAFNKDTTTVTYFVTDTLGNVEFCSFDVIVRDSTPPVLNCVEGVKFVNVALGDTSAIVDDIGIMPFDNCDSDLDIQYVIGQGNNILRSGSGDASGEFPVGRRRVEYTVTDDDGNVSTCDFIVDVGVDETTLVCPPDTTVFKDFADCGAIVGGLRPEVTPLSAVETVSYTLTGATEFESRTDTFAFASGTLFNVDTTIVTYTVTTARQDLTCSFEVVVLDTIPMTFLDCPEDFTVNTLADTCIAVPQWEVPMLSDTCGAIVMASHQPLDTFQIGETLVTYVAMNDQGETDTCSFTVTVRDQQTPSILNCPDDVILFAQVDTCGTTYSWELPDISDNCMIDTLISNFQPGDFFPVDTNIVTYMVMDMAGNTAGCSFDVIVLDTIVPMLENCPSDIMVASRAANCGNLVDWTPPTATDLCGEISITSNVEPNSVFGVGTTTVTYTATDASGNQSICSFDVTVVDETVPSIEQLMNIEVRDTMAACEVAVDWEIPNAADNCGIDTLIASIDPGSLFPEGETEVMYIAIDESGNRDTMTFLVIVELGGVKVENCPDDITVSAAPNQCGQIVSWPNEPQFNQQCLDGAEVVSSHQSGDQFPVGTTTVEYFVVDNRGDTLRCTFDVTVLDEQVPTFANCPQDTTINAAIGACEATYNWMPPTADDNCEVIEFSTTHEPGTTFPIGETTVSYTATDAAGGTSVCEFVVRVIDNTAPSFMSCPDTIQVRLDGTVVSDPSNFMTAAPTFVDCETVQLSFDAPTASDACSDVAVMQMAGPTNNTFGLGLTTLTYVAVDSTDNRDTCNVVFEVLPLEEIQVSVTNAQPCFGEEFTLEAEDTRIPGAEYRWSGLGINEVGREITLNSEQLMGDGAISVSVVQSNGCVRTGFAIIDVQPLPEPFITVNEPLCADGMSSMTLTADDTTGVTITDWTWEGQIPDSVASTGQVITIENISQANGGLYRLTATSDAGCVGRVVDTIIISNKPDRPNLNPVTPNFSTESCVGDTIKLIGTSQGVSSEMFNWAVTPDVGVVFNPADTNIVDVSFETRGEYTFDYWITANGCPSDTVSLTLNVGAIPNLMASFEGSTDCENPSDTLRLFETGGEALNWTWTGPEGDIISMMQNPVLETNGQNVSGIYTVTSQDGICTSSAQVEVSVSGALEQPDVEIPSLLCQNDTILLIANGDYTSTTGFNWRIPTLELTTKTDTNVLELPIFVSDSFIVLVEAVDGACQSTTDTVLIKPLPSPVTNLDSIITDHFCIVNDSLIRLIETGGEGVKYDWFGPDEFRGGSEEVFLNVDFESVERKNGTYFVEVLNADGCVTVDSITLNLFQGIPAPMIDGADIICEGESIDLIAMGLAPDSTVYTWTLPTGDTRTGTNISLSANPLLTGEYTVVADDGRCVSEPSEPYMVTVLSTPRLVNDQFEVLVNVGDTLNVIANDSLFSNVPVSYEVTKRPFRGVIDTGLGIDENGVINYVPNQDDVGRDNLTYEVCYQGCADPEVELCSTAFADIVIQYPDDVCVITNLVTPNDDGKNDVLIVTCAEGGVYPQNQITIYNQWGDKVFEAAPYQNDWGGTYNGSPLPDGTYYYFFTNAPGAEVQKGFITVYR